jgi:hypothetical protein
MVERFAARLVLVPIAVKRARGRSVRRAAAGFQLIPGIAWSSIPTLRRGIAGRRRDQSIHQRNAA